MNLAIAVGITIILGLFYGWTSRINGLFFFGRSVTQDFRFSPEARAITRQYLASIVLGTTAAALCAWAAVRYGGRSFALIGLLLEFVAFITVFARANGQTRSLLRTHPEWSAHAQSTREAALLQQPRYWVPGVAAISVPLIAALAMATAMLILVPHSGGLMAAFNSFGDSVDAHGESFVLGMACGLIVAATGVLVLFRASVRLRTRMARYSIRSSFAMLCIGSALLIGTLISNLVGFTMSRTFGRGLGLVALAVTICTMIWNQSQAKKFVPPPVEMGSDDRWRCGLFYVDRADPALFVQSRCGVGYTLNYGRIAAWPISIGVVAYFIATMFLLPHSR